MSDARDLLRSYLRQRAELGDDELVLDRHSAGELREMLRTGAGDGGRGTGGGVPAAARPGARPDAPAAIPPRDPRPADAQVHVRAGAQPPGETPMRPARDAPSRGVSAEEIAALPVLGAVREVSLGCPRCRLAETRTRVVFGEGSETAQLMAVGEAPGENEDRQGRPFVGKAGKLLDLLLMTAGFEREAVYICNTLKCRPPGNRNPLPDEVEACSPYLLKQVELVAPRVIVAFGTFAAQTLLGTDLSIGRLRGKLHQYRGIPVVPTYHPAALLRNAGWVRAVWEDLQRARAVLDRPS
ncbi:uracil-DNA glycosylase [Longimicrobium sp.]|uniref:uracil-DNA glycosylase n=1 Tax=Longimicrobium sp. TaxID=2029185 RepID=UPI002CEED602|nr:uracil-DNA glycosylase [Longimicrobium sp.]HSU16608.1 uracil-DNA glycosylase [Longimicrobium sp.]